MAKLYKVGMYTRLSTDDVNNSAKAKSYIPSHESGSIENQKLLLSKFIMFNGWIETKAAWPAFLCTPRSAGKPFA